MSKNPLQTKAVLADVTVRHWTGRKLDRRITDEVNKQHDAEADAGRYNKLLIPKEAFANVYAATRGARSVHHLMTQPWFDEGPRILPTALYDKFATELRKFRQEFEEAANEFDQEYPGYIQQARKRLKKMFNEQDYPSASKVRGMFSFHVSILPFPDVGDFRVKLGKEQLEDIKSDMEVQLKTAMDNAMKEPVRRIIQVVGKMAEKLKGYTPPDSSKGQKAEGLFRDTLVTNIRDLVELLPAFNLTEDKVLAELTKRMELELGAFDAQELREDERSRKKAVKAAEEILEQANALMA